MCNRFYQHVHKRLLRASQVVGALGGTICKVHPCVCRLAPPLQRGYIAPRWVQYTHKTLHKPCVDMGARVVSLTGKCAVQCTCAALALASFCQLTHTLRSNINNPWKLSNNTSRYAIALQNRYTVELCADLAWCTLLGAMATIKIPYILVPERFTTQLAQEKKKKKEKIQRNSETTIYKSVTSICKDLRLHWTNLSLGMYS